MKADKYGTCDQRSIVGTECGVSLCDICRADLAGFWGVRALRAPLVCQIGSESKVDDPKDEHPSMQAQRNPDVVKLGEKCS